MEATNRVVAGWVLEERLGSGGFGEVWRARRRHVGMYRALKLMPIRSETAFASWRHEIDRLEQLNHPNVVRFYDADVVSDPGFFGDVAWIATELCDRSLADEMRRRPDRLLTAPECLRLVEEMLGALAAAHGRGCVHRDIKPGNILLHQSGVWKLGDWGTARLIPTGESHPDTAVVGTSPYMSPAAHRGQQDQAADLYALGVTVHEALCGERLHPRTDGMSDSEYVKFILDTPPTISSRLDSWWRGLVVALTGLDGPHTAAELLTRLGTADATSVGVEPAVTVRVQEASTETRPTRRYDRPPPAAAARERDRRPRSASNEGRHIAALFALVISSLVVAAVLLAQLITSTVAVVGIVAAVLLAIVLMMALS